jgi:rhodanese-related sulfurtransferase
MSSFRELLAKAKSQIREVDTATADDLRRLPGTIVLDVREPDEYEQGALPGALHIPRGHLESQIEGKVSNREAPILVYCAAGVRSAFAAKTLQELGYSDVVSMSSGFGRWKDEGRDWETPTQLNAEQKLRYHRHLLLPGSGSKVRRSCWGGRFCCSARVGSAHRPRCISPPRVSAHWASSTWTSSTSRTCSARSSTTSIASVIARSTPRRRRSPR